MAAGLPVVAANNGALPDIVREGETGLLVSPGEVASLAAAITGLLADPERARAMGAAGRRRAAAEFSIERQVQQLGTLYKQILREFGHHMVARTR